MTERDVQGYQPKGSIDISKAKMPKGGSAIQREEQKMDKCGVIDPNDWELLENSPVFGPVRRILRGLANRIDEIDGDKANVTGLVHLRRRIDKLEDEIKMLEW